MARSIALVGCGAIAHRFYLQALAKRKQESDRIWLVDPGDSALVSAWKIVGGDKAHALSEITDELQCVIIASPNHTHFSLAQEALSRGAHVLIEKPFAAYPEEGRRLLELAAKSNRVIAVNQTRRLFANIKELRRRIDDNEFGELRSIAHSEGGKFDWPFQSGAAFGRDARRTGVIMDMGVHAIDFYQFIFQPRWKFIAATHDGFRGPEGLAEIKLMANEVPVEIRLSRYHGQKNTAYLSFERRDVFLNVFDWSGFHIREKSGESRFVSTGSQIKAFEEFSGELLSNFLAAAEGRETPICGAASSLPVIEILDEIYHRAACYPAEPGVV